MTAIYDKARYTKIICFQLCLILISSAPSFAGLMRANTATHEFASKSLNVYTKTLLTEQTVGKFGFKTLEEARSARLGRPLTLMTVGLRTVKAYQPGSGVKSLESEMPALWYPVVVDNRVVAKLEILEKDGKMISGDFGATGAAERVDAVLQRMPVILNENNLGTVANMMIFRVPHLRAVFLYLETARGEYLMPAMALPQRFDLQNGELYDVDMVLRRLKAHAEKIPEGLIR